MSEPVFVDMCSMLAPISWHRQVDLGHTDTMPAAIPIDDPADPRLADYVELDPTARAAAASATRSSSRRV